MDLKEIYKKIISAVSFTTDSREIQDNSVFFALRGENFDGNQYAEEAIRKGSTYAIIDNPAYAKDERYILVNNTLETLQELAKYHRNQMNSKIIAITGSNGKTTTKTLVYKALSKKYKTLTNIKNYNNHIGVPLTLLNIKQEHELAVIEMGANHPGEIDFLCRIAEPDYGLITNIGKAHLEGFGSFEGVKKTKKELYDYVCNHNGTIFYNYNNEILRNIVKTKNCYKVSYGTSPEATYRGSIQKLAPFVAVTFANEIINTQLVGEYNFENILSALCIGAHFEVPLQDLKKALERYIPENNRSQILETKFNKIVLDAYNANPTSMKAAIDSFATSDEKNKVLILGDMFELGDYGFEEHLNLVQYIDRFQFDKVFLVGEIFSSLPENDYHTFLSTHEFSGYLKMNPIKNKTILIKGSRGMELEKTTKFL